MHLYHSYAGILCEGPANACQAAWRSQTDSAQCQIRIDHVGVTNVEDLTPGFSTLLVSVPGSVLTRIELISY